MSAGIEIGNPIRILFLSANPSDMDRLAIDTEFREISSALEQTVYRDRFQLQFCGATRASDMQRYLLRFRPHIVHFSGHGVPSSQIVLEDDHGHAQLIDSNAIAELFRILKDEIRCVILNACYSEQQASAIAQYIDCVIGISSDIVDDAALKFSEAFYQGIAHERDIRTAYELGVNSLQLYDTSNSSYFRLLCMNGALT